MVPPYSKKGGTDTGAVRGTRQLRNYSMRVVSKQFVGYPFQAGLPPRPTLNLFKVSGGGGGLPESCTNNDSYLVDPASSHMLVLKIKPCMSKYEHHTARLRTAH